MRTRSNRYRSDRIAVRLFENDLWSRQSGVASLQPLQWLKGKSEFRRASRKLNQATLPLAEIAVSQRKEITSAKLSFFSIFPART